VPSVGGAFLHSYPDSIAFFNIENQFEPLFRNPREPNLQGRGTRTIIRSLAGS